VLALGMLTCIRKAFTFAKDHYGLSLTLANIPQDDPAVYEMVSHADTIGVFQIESRAQMSMLPRLRPKSFYDLVIEVAIVRPGPIQGDMVHPYLRRRNGEEKVEYPSPELEDILGRTLGIPLFQEQAMKIAIVAAGFTPAEADELRRSMATFKAKGVVAAFEQKLVSGMKKNGTPKSTRKEYFGNSRVLEVMVSPKVMRPALHCSSTFRRGSNVIILMFLHVRCSTACLWVFISRHRSLSMQKNMVSMLNPSISIIPIGTTLSKTDRASIKCSGLDSGK